MTKDLSKQRNILVFLVLGSLVLLGKSAQLQLFESKYKEKAQRLTLEKNVLYPSRGLIYDRNGELMVINKPIYELKVVYNKIDPQMDTSFFCELLDIDKATFDKNITKNWRDRKFSKSIPYTFLSKISPEKFSRFQEHLFRFPGFSPSIKNIRAYPHENAAHVLGYLGEVDQNKIDETDTDYESGDFIGKSGLEKTYEEVLKGKKGLQYLLKDNLGREVSSYSGGSLDSVAVPGIDIVTGIDLELQKYGEFLMENKRGSIVAIEPKTGEILTMVSAPGYDPNLLNLDEDRGRAFKVLLGDTLNKPFLDRSTLAKYPPGSIFKPILSLIAFQEGLFRANQGVSCPGEYQYRSFTYGCHNHPRPNNVEIALVHSCNSYFFQMVRDVIEKDGFSKPALGLNMLHDYLTNFGLGRKLGLDNVYENKGFIPSADYYNKLYSGRGWRSTYIMSIGIGQGELELTTLQMANLAAILANHGSYYTPHLVKEMGNGEMIKSQYRELNHVGIDSVHFKRVINGMRKTIDYGTGMQAKVPGITVCGKTGTSQNSFGADHSVFFAFAPEKDPKIAIAVYVENAGWGATIAAPIAGLMIEKYLKGEISPYMKRLEKRMENVILVAKKDTIE